jgi:hypothetical protein
MALNALRGQYLLAELRRVVEKFGQRFDDDQGKDYGEPGPLFRDERPNEMLSKMQADLQSARQNMQESGPFRRPEIGPVGVVEKKTGIRASQLQKLFHLSENDPEVGAWLREVFGQIDP